MRYMSTHHNTTGTLEHKKAQPIEKHNTSDEEQNKQGRNNEKEKEFEGME